MQTGEEELRDDEGYAAEYNIVREEIITRIKMRQRLIAITLTVAGAFLSVGLSKPTVAFVYPPLAAFLAVAWGQNDYRVRDLAKYIRKRIEPQRKAFGWESYMENMRSMKHRGAKGMSAWRFVVISHGGVFLVTQSMAVFIGAVGFLGEVEEYISLESVLASVLGALDILAIGVVVWVVATAKR